MKPSPQSGSRFLLIWRKIHGDKAPAYFYGHMPLPVAAVVGHGAILSFSERSVWQYCRIPIDPQLGRLPIERAVVKVLGTGVQENLGRGWDLRLSVHFPALLPPHRRRAWERAWRGWRGGLAGYTTTATDSLLSGHFPALLPPHPLGEASRCEGAGFSCIGWTSGSRRCCAPVHGDAYGVVAADSRAGRGQLLILTPRHLRLLRPGPLA